MYSLTWLIYSGRVPLCLENLVDISIFIPAGDTKTPEGSLKPLKSPLIATFKAFLEDLVLSPTTDLEVLILNIIKNGI